MHIHILGICGTFMGGLALLARELGHEVTGSDANVYPPMSDQLGDSGIRLFEGYDSGQFRTEPDLVVIGNALSRGNPAVEWVLDHGMAYTSGPGFLQRHVLQGRWVLAVAGTHGKTTVSSMLAWILEHAGLQPGFLIGGVPNNFGRSARLGGPPFFVVEADEYDSAFFDKRSKFVHYRPRTLIMNNLEFDHADIFPDLEAIKRQCHHLVRTVPASGLIVAPAGDDALDDTLAMGCWTPVERFQRGGDAAPAAGVPWSTHPLEATGESFALRHEGTPVGEVHWAQVGQHNRDNALAAVIAARHAGVPPAASAQALSEFRGVRRRLEKRASVKGIEVYDDFAHHPTAISATLEGLRRAVGKSRILAVLELRSNTMKMGVHKEAIAPALAAADEVALYQSPGLEWPLGDVAAAAGPRCRVFTEVEAIIDHLVAEAREGDRILIMSNGGFDGIHERLIGALKAHGN